jgi:hypothetical protein
MNRARNGTVVRGVKDLRRDDWTMLEIAYLLRLKPDSLYRNLQRAGEHKLAALVLEEIRADRRRVREALGRAA